MKISRTMQNSDKPSLDVNEIYEQAVADAIRGDKSAISWLDTLAPDWRERVVQPFSIGKTVKLM